MSTATTAHVARPDTGAKTAILLIQEWWGINAHIRDIASRYANEGLICVAPDLYRGKLAKTTEEASAMMHGLAIEDGMETIRVALAETKSKYNVQQLGITGYCMGGTFAFRGLDPHVAGVVAGHVADDREAEPGAARLAAPGPIDAVEALEHALEVATRDPDPVVLHLDVDPPTIGAGADLHARTAV